MPPSAKILVIRGGAIGDFILTLPVFAALRQQFPGCHIEVLGYPHVAKLALLDGAVEAVKPIEARALAGFFARNGALDEEWAEYFSQFALIISYLYDPDQIFQANLERCATGQFIAGPHRPAPDSDTHATGVFLKPLERLAIFSPDPVPRINLPPIPVPPLPPAPRVALHLGSGSASKNWPERQWAEFCDLVLMATDCKLLLVGGEAEGERTSRLAAGLPPDRVSVAQSLPLPELARYLACCQSFVGHDSGVSHLAGALGLDALLLWGETAEEVWRPLNSQVAVFKNPDGLARLPATTVFELWREWTR